MKLLDVKSFKAEINREKNAEIQDSYLRKAKVLEEIKKFNRQKDVLEKGQALIEEDFEKVYAELGLKKEELEQDILRLKAIKDDTFEGMDDLKKEILSREELVNLGQEKIIRDNSLHSAKEIALEKKEEKLRLWHRELKDKETETAKNIIRSEAVLQTSQIELQKQLDINVKLTKQESQLAKKEITLVEREEDIQVKIANIEVREQELKNTLKLIESRQASLKSAYQALKK